MKRVFACILDLIIYLLLFFLVNPYIIQFIDFSIGHVYLYTTDYVSIISLLIYFILFEVIFNTSPGKWLYNLRITSNFGLIPKKKLLFYRAVLKLFTLITVFGAIVNCILIINDNFSWYDNVLNLSVKVTKK